MRSWVYAEKLRARSHRHVVSDGEQARCIEFWWDVTMFDGHECFLRDSGAGVGRLRVFQERRSDVRVLGRPVVWSLVEFHEADESRAVAAGAALVREHAARLTLFTGLPFSANGGAIVVELTASEHGWLPRFEGRAFKGVDSITGPPTVSTEDPEDLLYPATRRIPLNQALVGMVAGKDILDIGFTDTMRQVDRHTEIDVAPVRVSEGDVRAMLPSVGSEGVAPVLLQAAVFYAGAMAQEEPENQFVLLWAVVEALVNSIAGEPMLTNAQIEQVLDSVRLDGESRQRLAGALRRVTVESFRERVRKSFAAVFGRCQPDADRKLARLRELRGRLLHPRDGQTRAEGDVVRGLIELRDLIEEHLRHAKKRSEPETGGGLPGEMSK